jgi:hypothetical protein
MTIAFKNLRRRCRQSRSCNVGLLLSGETMQLRSVIFYTFSASLLSDWTSFFLQAQTGSIAGTVTESLRKTLLTGGEIAVEGSTLKTATGDSGRYTLLGVPAGKAKLTVSYLGLDPQSQGVTVTGGVTISLDFSLSPSLKPR